MKVSILFKKIMNLGTHGEICYQAIEPIEGETVEHLVERLLTEPGPSIFPDQPRVESYSEHIELRLINDKQVLYK